MAMHHEAQEQKVHSSPLFLLPHKLLRHDNAPLVHVLPALTEVCTREDVCLHAYGMKGEGRYVFMVDVQPSDGR